MFKKTSGLFILILSGLLVVLVLGQIYLPKPEPAAVGPRSNAPAGRVQTTTVPIAPGDIHPAGNAIVGFPSKMDISPALRDIPAGKVVYETNIREMDREGENEEIVKEGERRPQIEDPVLQSQFFPGGSSPQPAAPQPGANFEGLGNIDGVYPPDTNGDVGPNHYIQMVNLHFQIFNKTGVSLYGPAANNTIWSGFGAPCATRNDGDPVVLYDSIANRWIMSQFTAQNPYGECIAVSTSPDPTGSYYRYFFQFSTSVFYDYPKLGVWPDGYYLSANRFGGIFQTFQGPSAIVLERNQMLVGQPARFIEFQASSNYGTLLPSDLDGPSLPPAGEPNFFAEIGSTALHLWKFHVDWATPANSTFTGPTSLTVAPYNQLCAATRNCVSQPGTSVRVDGIGDRLMHRLAYRNFGDHESLVVSHNVNAASNGTQAAVRWYEVRSPNSGASIYQQGTFAPDTNQRWMGSLAMDGSGDIALGYSISSSSVYPSIRYTGRLSSDQLGQMTQGETTLMAGSGSQTGSGARWGDYSSMSIDPVDDCTFWYTTEYIPVTGTAPWQTRIGSFRFPSCGSTPPSPTPTQTNTPTATITDTPTSTNTPTSTSTATPAAANTDTPTPTATSTSTPTPIVNNTPTPTSTATNTPSPAACPNLSAGYCLTNNETRAWIAGTTNTTITGDDQVKIFALPFTFVYFGQSYTSLKVSSNGNAQFGRASTAFTNRAIPNTTRPNALLAIFWDDLDPSAGGAIYSAVTGSPGSQVLTIEWRDVRRYGAGNSGATFEIQLVEGTNEIWYLYQDTQFGNAAYDNGASATGGIENVSGTAGNQFSFNSPALTNGLVLHFYPQP